MQMHRGFSNLDLSSNGCVLDGDYFTGRGRKTHGSLHLEKVLSPNKSDGPAVSIARTPSIDPYRRDELREIFAVGFVAIILASLDRLQSINLPILGVPMVPALAVLIVPWILYILLMAVGVSDD